MSYRIPIVEEPVAAPGKRKTATPILLAFAFGVVIGGLLLCGVHIG